MDKQITPDIEKQLEALCAEISVAQKLDEEVQEELYGHLEDKYLAYMNKEEEVGPQDAVILVREHFGDAAALQELLRDVHGQVPSVSFWLGIEAVFIAYHGVSILMLAIVLLLHQHFTEIATHENHSALFYLYKFLGIGNIYLIPLIWILLLLIWIRKQNTGKTMWYQKCNSGLLFGCCVMILLISSRLWYYTFINNIIPPSFPCSAILP